MRRAYPRPSRRARGYTLVELMVTLVITLLVLAAGLAFYLMSRNSYATIDDNSNLQERGQFAMSVVTRLARQAAFTPLDTKNGGPMSIPDAMLGGLDACTNPQVSVDANNIESLSCGAGTAINNSDVLLVRYFGVSSLTDSSQPDGSVIDCSGQGVAGFTDSDNAARQRGMSMLYVGTGANGKPSLMCRYRTRAAGVESMTDYVTQELVPGVEAMQVLYGLALNDDEVPDKYVNANAMSASDWKNVLTVKVSMVVRADNASADAGGPGTIQMFGPLGSDLDSASFTPTEDLQSARKLYTATVQLHNYQSCLAGALSCQ